MVYVSLTSLALPWNPIKQATFWYWAISCNRQAMSMALEARVTSMGGEQVTMTVWKNRKEMLNYVHSGAHKEVLKMKLHHNVAAGLRFYSYETDTVPTWKEGFELLTTKGRSYGCSSSQGTPIQPSTEKVIESTELTDEIVSQ